MPEMQLDDVLQITQSNVTVLDFFAGQALAGLVLSDPDESRSCEGTAVLAYQYARAMIDERSKPQ
jgi:hypothetical protein